MRILQILTRPNLGGPMRHLQALGRSAPWQPENGPVQVLMAVGRCPADEAELCCDELREVAPADVDTQATGMVRIPALGPRLHPLRDRRAAAAIRQLIRRFRPHVVHTHTSKAGLLGRRAATAAQVPVVAHTFHGHVLRDYYGATFNALMRTMERRLARQTNLVFAVSGSCRDELEELGVGVGRIRVLPPAVDLAPFSARANPAARHAAQRALGVQDARPLVGFVGRMVPVKQPELFVAMARQLPGVQAVMFGDGPGLAGLRGSHGDVIRFLGAVPDLQRYLPALDLLVLTSRREGFPLAALEARACGVALVGLDRPGIRDALAGGDCGLLVPPESSPVDLATAVQSLLEDARRRHHYVAQGLSNLWAYHPDRVATALTQHYAAVLADSPASAAVAGTRLG
ncbi:MAG: glycosyltransferase [Planctomycetota bacterium]